MFEKYLRLFSLVRRHWQIATVMGVCVTALTGFRVLVPFLTGAAVNDIVAKAPVSSVAYLAVEIVAVSAASAAFSFGLSYGGQALGQKLIYDIRNTIFTSIQSQSFSFYDRNETGQLMSRATGDVEAVRRFVAFGLGQLLSNTFLVGGVIVSLFYLNLYLAAIVIIVFPLIFFLSWKFSQTQGPFWRLTRRNYGTMNSVLQQNVTGARIVRSFTAEEAEMSRFASTNQAYRDGIVGSSAVRAIYVPLLSLVISLDLAALYYLGGGRVIAGTITLGELVAAANLLALLSGPSRFLGQLILIGQNGMAGFDRILEVIDAKAEVKDNPGAIQIGEVKGEIRFEGVWFGYRAGRDVLKGVDLEIKPGQVVAFVGFSGSGKTTMANLIPRFYDVTRGAVKIDGKDVRDVTLKSLRGSVGLVSQDIFLFSATIRENVCYGRTDASQEDVERVCKVARADEFIERFPERYETRVGERGVTLSGGQKQRIAIARTLLTDPRILILDDSLSSVDAGTEYAIADALKEVVKQRTTIIITQRLSTLRLAQRIVVFDGGKVVEDGDHTELLARNGTYAKLYRSQYAPQDVPSTEAYR
ncbi:MAG: ABC transporter ATP-binding protein [Nitrososphaerota archaeon]|nr:ABC transporter ATP-binding protein [Nitrososphaerota archaeon]MDG6919733.1 ABC transporter ATP-binding protein [Nitrososphaerota archaeon]MDG6941987.1 ABC transporter ATP-binding protein [Nitrososphaerota archaeon]